MSKKIRLLLAALAILIVMAALWALKPWQPGSASPSQVEIGSQQPFAWVDCKARLFDGAPAVAVMFTQPLAGSQDWGKLIKASEGETPSSARPLEARWVLGDNPRMLYLPHVTPDRTYHIALNPALAAAASGTLGVAQNCSVKSEAMSTSVYFASRGVVLPAGQNGGLPVVTVNTPEVDVQFLRIEAASLPAFLEQVGGRRENPTGAQALNENQEGFDESGYGDVNRRLKGRVPGFQLDELRALSTSVYVSRFATDARPNRRNVSFVPVEKIKELQEPGIYVAVMNPPGRFGQDYQVTYFYVTDIGLHVRRHAAQTDVFTTSLKSGEALRGVELTLIDDAAPGLPAKRLGSAASHRLCALADLAATVDRDGSAQRS